MNQGGMLFSNKYILPFYRIYQIWDPLTSQSVLMVLHKMRTSLFECKKHISSSGIILKKNSKIPYSFSNNELFSKKTAPLLLDVEEERQKLTKIEEEFDEFKGINLKRGLTGVFDIEEVVKLLQKEKGEDIFVGKIPSECNYAGFIVVASGKSTKHMLAMCNLIRRIYKKKVIVNNQIPQLEGQNSDIWMALDLGNIILHVFSKKGRKVYDLESLWSVGKEFDIQSQIKGSSSHDTLIDYAKILTSLSPNT